MLEMTRDTLTSSDLRITTGLLDPRQQAVSRSIPLHTINIYKRNV